MHVLDVRPGITDPASIKFRNENGKEPLFLFIDMSGVSQGATHSSLPSGGKVWMLEE